MQKKYTHKKGEILQMDRRAFTYFYPKATIARAQTNRPPKEFHEAPLHCFALQPICVRRMLIEQQCAVCS